MILSPEPHTHTNTTILPKNFWVCSLCENNARHDDFLRICIAVWSGAFWLGTQTMKRIFRFGLWCIPNTNIAYGSSFSFVWFMVTFSSWALWICSSRHFRYLFLFKYVLWRFIKTREYTITICELNIHLFGLKNILIYHW